MSSNSRYRAAPQAAVAETIWESPIGPLAILASERGLRLIEFVSEDEGGDIPAGSAGVPPVHARRRPPEAETSPKQLPAAEKILAETIQQLQDYFAGRRREFNLPLDLRGTPFQAAIWRALMQIRYAETITYRRLANAAGRPDAVRATGAANAANPLSIVIPCHRVIGSNGSLTGYAGGLAAKRFLLELEQGRVLRTKG